MHRRLLSRYQFPVASLLSDALLTETLGAASRRTAKRDKKTRRGAGGRLFHDDGKRKARLKILIL